jgi:uncharacterized protein
MPDADATPAWREVVREAAYEAAVTETRTTWGTKEIFYNYRWEHVQAVVRLAMRLAELTGADAEIVEAAAWLHDVAKGESKDHGPDGAIAARRILSGTDYPPIKTEAVAVAIARHVGLWTDEPIEPLEAAVVWDADKLSKLGATAVLHFTGYLINLGEGATIQLIDHLSDDDGQMRIVRSFNTTPARIAGRVRLEAFRAFCRQAAQELDGDDLPG